MSFISEWKTLIESDASVNALLTGGVKFCHLPVDYDITKKWVVWDYSKESVTDTLNTQSIYTTYKVYITITDTDTVSLNNISDLLITHLVNYSSATMPSVEFMSDAKNPVLTQSQNTYQNSLEFSAIFF